MIQNGLDTGKWSAYGYFDGGNLIAYLDNKLRIDGSVELGALLTEPKYRRYHLASTALFQGVAALSDSIAATGL